MTVQLGKVEEQRILAVADVEKLKVCKWLGDVGEEDKARGRGDNCEMGHWLTLHLHLGCIGRVRQAV